MSTRLLLVFLFFAVLTIKASRLIKEDPSLQENRKGVVAKVIEILQGTEEMTNAIRYLELAERDLQDNLPTHDSGMVTISMFLNSYLNFFFCSYRG